MFVVSPWLTDKGLFLIALQLLGMLPPLRRGVHAWSWLQSGEKYRFRTQSIWDACGPYREIFACSTPKRIMTALPAEVVVAVRKNCTHVMPFNMPVCFFISLFPCLSVMEVPRQYSGVCWREIGWSNPVPHRSLLLSPFQLWERPLLLNSSPPCSVALREGTALEKFPLPSPL